ncbi:unnamed protein product [Gongylonema pulchrum]|uniref:Ion_trans_2 domain-containing protein n=1 Tax=Gongylonema pulchrum TaxID=637853 RepID=A0A183D2D1_9BILA|nr:unnamed protein product [Gongylonema pulchrum]
MVGFSTIGLGDITPTQPKYLLMLFIYIIIGLSLVSMCINLIQVKFLPRNLSVDDVMKLVDTEESDIIMITELIRDDSNLSDISESSDASGQVC